MHFLGALGLIALAAGGYVAGVPLVAATLPASPIVLGLVLTLACLAVRPSGTPASWKALWLPVTVAAVFLLGVPFAQTDTAYGQEKLTLLLLVPVCVWAGREILQAEQARWWWLVFVVAYGYLVAALMLVAPDAREALSGRLAVEGSNTIAGAMATAGGALVLAVLAATGARRPGGLLLATVPLLLAALATGSRGPVLAAVTAGLFVVVAARGARRRGPLLVLVVGGAATVWVGRQGGVFLNRFAVTTDASTEARVLMWRFTLDHSAAHPLGTGWGSLDVAYAQTSGLRSMIVAYPHNLPLEVAAEAGWLALLILVTVVVWVVSRQVATADGPAAWAMVALVVFFAVEAMFSGDVPSHRTLWVMLGAAAAAPYVTRPRLVRAARTSAAVTAPAAGSDG